MAGELSRVTQAPSGHWYFVLKDEGAAVDCAMFRGRAQYLDFRPENGMRVEVRARVSGILEARRFVEGSAAKAGDVLFQIDPEPYRAAVAQARRMAGALRCGPSTPSS